MSEDKRKEEELAKLNEGMENAFDDFLGLDEPEVYIDYVCVDCGCMDPVPEFIVAECAMDMESGEEPEFFCPECNGTLVRKQEPTDTETVG